MASNLIDDLLGAASGTEPMAALDAVVSILERAGFEYRPGAEPGWLGVSLAELDSTINPPTTLPAEDVVRAQQLLTLAILRVRDWDAKNATEQRIATFSEACFEGLFVLDDLRVVDANTYLYKLLGYHPSELINSEIFDLCFDAQEKARVLALLEQGAKGEVVVARRKDGSVFQAEMHSKVVPYGRQHVRVVAMRDVTEREQTQADLQERERHLAEWAAVAFNATVVSDGVTILEAGGRTRELLGYEPSELVGKRVLDFVAPPSRRTVERVVADHHTGAYEINLLSKHGDLVPVEIVSAVSTWRGLPVRFAGLRDRREFRRLEAERYRLEQRVERGDRLQSWGTLAAGISHDFGNLLVGITANAEVLMHHCKTDEASDYAKEIYTAGRRAADLVSELLTSNGEPDSLTKELLDVGELFIELRRLLAAKLASTATVVMHIEPGCTVLGNRARLSQVFMNLLVNASDALEGKPGQISVTINTLQELDSRWDDAWGAQLSSGAHVLIAVQDTGVGMDPDLIERAFEPFFTTKHSGSGLGLAACLGTVKAHDGAIHVLSEREKGTCFSVLLPASSEPARTEVRRISGQAPRAGHVMVLDDEPLVRSQLRRSLESRGYRVSEARSVEDAAQLLDQAQPDVLLVDMMIGDSDGVEFLSHLRQQGLLVPAVLISGFIDPRLEETLSPGPFQAFLRKPYSVQELMDTLDDVMHCPDQAPRAIRETREVNESQQRSRVS